jgi:prevent-host-death family protein
MMIAMKQRRVTAAEAKRRLSSLLDEVASGRQSILIERRGEPVARLVPVDRPPKDHLADARGWLDDDDPFFGTARAVSAAGACSRPSRREPRA